MLCYFFITVAADTYTGLTQFLPLYHRRKSRNFQIVFPIGFIGDINNNTDILPY